MSVLATMLEMRMKAGRDHNREVPAYLLGPAAFHQLRVECTEHDPPFALVWQDVGDWTFCGRPVYVLCGTIPDDAVLEIERARLL